MLLLALLPTVPAVAAPRVTTDIAPVQALVAQLMQGAGMPAVLLPATADPHHHALRPSQARALQQADLVVWIGPALTPWLAKALSTLAPDATDLHLLEADEKDDDHDHSAGHDHAESDPAHDPHQWLDPVAMQNWLPQIAEALIRLDPANAAIYRANLQTTLADLDALSAQIAAQLDPVRDRPMVTAHAALGPFAARYGLTISDSLSDSDATRPGAAHIREMRATMAQHKVACMLTELGQTPENLRALIDGLDLKLVEIDALGARHEQGPDLYRATLTALSANIVTCLAP